MRSPVSRRRVLVSTSGALLALASGCLDRVDGGASMSSPSPDGETIDEDAPDRTDESTADEDAPDRTDESTADGTSPTGTVSPCSDPSRPRPDVEAGADELGPVAYPDPLPAPREATDEELLAYVGDYETAYRRNSVIESSGPLLGFGTGSSPSTVDDRDDRGAVVRWSYTFSYDVENDGRTVHADSPTQVVAYFVFDGGVYRSHAEGHDATPDDPRVAGRALECFD